MMLLQFAALCDLISAIGFIFNDPFMKFIMYDDGSGAFETGESDTVFNFSDVSNIEDVYNAACEWFFAGYPVREDV